jgi:hypothetical protein
VIVSDAHALDSSSAGSLRAKSGWILALDEVVEQVPALAFARRIEPLLAASLF